MGQGHCFFAAGRHWDKKVISVLGNVSEWQRQDAHQQKGSVAPASANKINEHNCIDTLQPDAKGQWQED